MRVMVLKLWEEQKNNVGRKDNALYHLGLPGLEGIGVAVTLSHWLKKKKLCECFDKHLCEICY
jgi:hypothetical protein